MEGTEEGDAWVHDAAVHIAGIHAPCEGRAVGGACVMSCAICSRWCMVCTGNLQQMVHGVHAAQLSAAVHTACTWGSPSQCRLAPPQAAPAQPGKGSQPMACITRVCIHSGTISAAIPILSSTAP